MLSAIGSVLVAGSRLEIDMSDTQVKALRGFRGHADGMFREVLPGQTVMVTLAFARELGASNKAEIVAQKSKAEAKAEADEAKADAAEAKKESKHAR